MKKKYLYTVYPPNGKEFDIIMDKVMGLAHLQTLVEGYIELLPREYYKSKKWGHCRVYVNEEGRLNNLPVNKHFTDIELPRWEVLGVAVREKRVSVDKT